MSFALPRPPVTPGTLPQLQGGKITKKVPLVGALLNSRRVPWSGRPTIGTVGVHGAGEWQIPSSDGDGTVSQDYPKKDDARVVFRGKWRNNRGYYLAAKVSWQPSGGQQYYDIPTSHWYWDSPPAGGHVEITVTTENSDTFTRTITPPISKKQYYGEETSPGGAWSAYGETWVHLRPDVLDPNQLQDWYFFDGEVTVTYYGGVRIHEVVLFELPYAISGSGGETNPDTAYLGMSTGQGLESTNLGTDYPDLPLMRHLIMTHTLALDYVCGPHLLSWYAWDDVATSVADTDVPSVDITSTTLVSILDGTSTLWSDDIRGWSTAAGSTSRRRDLSGEVLELRDSDGVVSVEVSVYAKTTGDPGVVRVQSSTASFVEIPITSTTYAWHSITGELRVGIGAEDPTVCVALGRVTTGGDTLSVKGISITDDATRREMVL